MYKVLLVDDEPIILTGIKFMLDWESHDCRIIDTARNGQQALEKIQKLLPDIVICDINMPLLSGTELLKIVSERYPAIVFIMLTNHQEFDLARESLRLRATDYLLKNQLEPEILAESIANAKAERDNRATLARAELADGYREINRKQLLEDTFLRMVQGAPGSPVDETIAVLTQNDVRPGFALIYLPMDFSAMEEDGELSDDDRRRLFSWEREVAENLAKNFFTSYSLFAPDQQCDSLMLLCWGLDRSQWDERLKLFHEKLVNASSNITQAYPCLLSTEVFDDIQLLDSCRSQLFTLRDYFYLTGCHRVAFDQMPSVTYRSLGLSGIAGSLAAELAAKNMAGCAALLDKAIKNVEELPHRKSQAVWLCVELYGTAHSALKEQMNGAADEHGYSEIDRLSTRKQVLSWLQHMHNEFAMLRDQHSNSHSELMEKARQYVADNVYKRIMLRDVADYVCISPGYLSATFKKVYNQNFVDFINLTKMEVACRLIEEGQHRIGEISYMLNFDNAYYFTKVFKRHTGMTPTDYQRKLKGKV